MAKAFWTIVAAQQDANGRWVPNITMLPSVTFINGLDINRLPAGAAPADHVHLIVGNIALMSDQPGGAHEHFVTHVGTTLLRGAATAHAHANPGGPDLFLCYVRCSDADFATLIAAPNNVKPLVMIDVTLDAGGNPVYGGMVDVAWAAGSPNDYERPAFWNARALSLFGINLPAAVDRGKRLWLLLAGLFQSRRPADDTGLRG